VATEKRLVVFFEAPHRIRKTLTDLGKAIGLERSLGIARELTKTHEELVIRPISDHLLHFLEPKGEFTVLLPPSAVDESARALPAVSQLREELGELTNNGGLRRRKALKVLAERHGMAVNDLYKALGDTDEDG
jgi:Predicted methyltransferases